MPTPVTELPRLPLRARDSHKGSFGKLLIIAGSKGMSGAAILAATAAMRSGAGLVQVATPADTQAIVAGGNPCYTTMGLPVDVAGHFRHDVLAILESLAASASVLAIGPGLGQFADRKQLIELMLTTLSLPMVLDADALNALGPLPDGFPKRSNPTIMTPHPGEFARLLGITTQGVQAAREPLAVQFAKQNGVVLVLKGHETIVTDGDRVYCNTTGNPGMAKGGSGDVLTGIIAALVAQGMTAFDSAQLGVYWHGLAGDLAAKQFGEVSMLPTDLIDFLPKASFDLQVGKS